MQNQMLRALLDIVNRTTMPGRLCFRAAMLAAALGGCAGPSAEMRAGSLGAEQEGMATYYSPRLSGHRTANGERYDPAQFTAAHPVIPFGRYVLVARTDGSGRTVVVRINDRCAGRKKIIDVSEAAARQLDMVRAGLVSVRIKIVAGDPSAIRRQPPGVRPQRLSEENPP
jgi:rare lipoprotein A